LQNASDANAACFGARLWGNAAAQGERQAVKGESEMLLRYGLAILAYLVPSFILGFIWHLGLFEQYYADLHIYRSDIIIPLGLLSMLIQSVIFAWLYDKTFANRRGTWLTRGLAYGGLGAVLSWSFTTLAVAAKNLMASVPDYLLIETAFTLVQWAIVGPLVAAAFALTAARSRSVAS
jgi:hypothetical protein